MGVILVFPESCWKCWLVVALVGARPGLKVNITRNMLTVSVEVLTGMEKSRREKTQLELKSGGGTLR